MNSGVVLSSSIRKSDWKVAVRTLLGSFVPRAYSGRKETGDGNLFIATPRKILLKSNINSPTKNTPKKR